MANILNDLAEVSKYLTEEARDQRLADIIEEAMEELATGTPKEEKWIPASEGMPKYERYGQKYWVCTQYRYPSGAVGERKVCLLRWEQTTIRGKTVERFKTLWDGVVYDEVIAWMPLVVPKPPMMD